MASSIMGSPLSLFSSCKGDSFSCERVVVVVVSRRSADRWSDRFGSRVISLHFSLFRFSVSRYHLLSWPFRENNTKRLKNESAKKRTLATGAVLELAGDSRELRELGGLRREMGSDCASSVRIGVSRAQTRFAEHFARSDYSTLSSSSNKHTNAH